MDIQNPHKPRCRLRRGESSLSSRKKSKPVTRAGFLYLRSVSSPFIFSTSDSIYNSICLPSDQIFTFGRKNSLSEVAIKDHRVSKRHCQIFVDSLDCKIFIIDGFLCPDSDRDAIKSWLRDQSDRIRSRAGFIVRPSLNGVFINGSRIERGGVRELSVGDVVSFFCGNVSDLDFRIRVGFVIERIIFAEEVALGHCHADNMLDVRAERIYKDSSLCRLENKELIARASILLNKCRAILQSTDPIPYIQSCVNLNRNKETMVCENGLSVTNQNDHNHFQDSRQCKMVDISSHQAKYRPCRLNTELNLVYGSMNVAEKGSVILCPQTVLASESCLNPIVEMKVLNQNKSIRFSSAALQGWEEIGNGGMKAIGSNKSNNSTIDSAEKINSNDPGLHCMKGIGYDSSSAGKTFFLNRLEFMGNGSSAEPTTVSLPELISPVESLQHVFVATFTSDVLWFLSCCKLPKLLPVTVACHNKERCWSASLDKRTCAPYPDYPNLVVVYPPFPEAIAFGKDRKNQGVGCHHPKLLVLQREDSIRVIVTSANLVPTQWHEVTNTVWWQDFPPRITPDYSSLFTHLSLGETNEELKSDFASQLAGFMASILADVPSQAQWILGLTKYDFRGAVGHIIASIPGMHMRFPSYPVDTMHFLSVKQTVQLTGMKFLGCVSASVVGISYRFHTQADLNGAQLKTLAAFLRKCPKNVYGMSEVILKRNANIPADANAVSVLVCDFDEYSEGDYIQLGFLPKDVAKWVAPLCDAGFFSFSACIHPKEVLAAALGGSNSKVELIMYVSQGPNFPEISRLIQSEHVPAFCSLLASVQRCVGLWRLQEVLCRYKWPESLETDFVYGASSIGTSVNAQFLAAFSAAAGKRSYQFSESEESDPEWGRWNACHELRSPSIKIIFPTINTVKNGARGHRASRYLLSLSEKTWQRLRTTGIFHDAVPYPSNRVGYPMHVKVARRRFQSKTCSSSFGWIYCGSQNFSAAAWGQPISASSITDAGRAVEATVLGSRLHICNYEIGIIFIVPPPDTASKATNEKNLNLDDIVLPFVVPPPKYGHGDRPATAQAMREALTEFAWLEKDKSMGMSAIENLMDDEEIPDEEEILEATEYVVEEKEDEKVYAETLWSQVDSSEG